MSDYTPSNVPLGGSRGVSGVIRREFDLIAEAISGKADSGDVTDKAPIDSPAFTGTPTALTAVPGTNTTQLATTAFVQTKADLDSPAFTGVPTAPTAAPGTNTTQLATTAFVQTKADLDSPAFTGVPTAPTAVPGTNTTQLATTAFVGSAAFNSALPAQTGNEAKMVISTDGTDAFWAPAYAAIFAGMSVTGYGYTDGVLTDIDYITGNRQEFVYNDGLLEEILYFDDDSVTLLATQTLGYTDGLLTTATWS